MPEKLCAECGKQAMSNPDHCFTCFADQYEIEHRDEVRELMFCHGDPMGMPPRVSRSGWIVALALAMGIIAYVGLVMR